MRIKVEKLVAFWLFISRNVGAVQRGTAGLGCGECLSAVVLAGGWTRTGREVAD